jgi:hypothetical protein
MKGKTVLIVICVIFCISCRNTSKKSEAFVFPEADSIPVSEAEKLSPEAIADISRNISSPVEIANLLQTLQVPFSQNYLATSIDPARQSTNFDKALKLGVLGADLGYLNMYEKTSSSLDVLASIRKLAEDLKVGQFFDFESIKRLSQNRSNLDSLLFISINSYNKIDNYLRSNERGHLSALMIFGVWLEGEYMASEVISQFPDKRLSDRIGEQKIILNDLLLLFRPYCNHDPEFRDLCSDLQKIKEQYQPVRITYTQGNPVTEEKNGGLVITQTETSVVEMTGEQLNSINETIKIIRNKLISNN